MNNHLHHTPNQPEHTMQSWNTLHERQTFDDVLNNANRLLEDDVSSLCMDDLAFLWFDVLPGQNDTNANANDGDSSSGIALYVNAALAYGRSIFSRIVNTVQYGADITVADLPDNDTAVLEFRFWKDDLQRVATLLWPKIEPYLQGT
jgi:hypothetical protein